MAYTPKELLEIHTFDLLPRDASVFSSHGGVIADADARRSWSVNGDLANSFMNIHRHIGNTTPFMDVARALGLFDSRTSTLLPGDVQQVSFWEEDTFWKEISTRFTQKSDGTVSVAVTNASANTIFRLFEFPALMENPKVDNVRVIVGKPLGGDDFQYVNTLSRTFGRASYVEVEALELQVGKDHLRLLDSTMAYDRHAVMDKQEWANWQKQEWFEASIGKLLCHLEGKPHVRHDLGSTSRSMYDLADENLIDAKARFLQEVVISLREETALRNKSAQGDVRAAQSLVQERARLAKCHEIMEKYPEALYFDEKPTAAETQRGQGRQIDRERHLTQHMGMMFLRLDTGMDIEAKNKLWGRYHDYDRSERHAKPGCTGQPDMLEEYVRNRITGLKQQVQNALKPATARPKPRETLTV